MYVFTIKDNGGSINAVVIRSLLALGGIASLLYHGHEYLYINIIAAVALFAAALFVNRLLTQYKIPVLVLMTAGAFFVLAATLFIPFAALLIAYGLLAKKLYTAPVVKIHSGGVHIIKPFGNTEHAWTEFNNIILKDNLLTLDFRNNTLLQLLVAEISYGTDEQSFNEFCSGFIGI
jgi:hypothetical protein